MTMRLWPALVLAAAIVVAAPAVAQVPASGTKNFSVPGGVPNYFSNEAGAPLGSGGIVHPHTPQPSVAEEEQDRPSQRAVASNRYRAARHVATAKRGRHGRRFAAAHSRHRATRFAAARKKAHRLAAARTGPNRQAAEHPSARGSHSAKPIKAEAQNKPAAKPKQPARHG